jgi:hypothetical protein
MTHVRGVDQPFLRQEEQNLTEIAMQLSQKKPDRSGGKGGWGLDPQPRVASWRRFAQLEVTAPAQITPSGRQAEIFFRLASRAAKPKNAQGEPLVETPRTRSTSKAAAVLAPGLTKY